MIYPEDKLKWLGDLRVGLDMITDMAPGTGLSVAFSTQGAKNFKRKAERLFYDARSGSVRPGSIDTFVYERCGLEDAGTYEEFLNAMAVFIYASSVLAWSSDITGNTALSPIKYSLNTVEYKLKQEKTNGS